MCGCGVLLSSLSFVTSVSVRYISTCHWCNTSKYRQNIAKSYVFSVIYCHRVRKLRTPAAQQSNTIIRLTRDSVETLLHDRVSCHFHGENCLCVYLLPPFCKKG